MSPGARALVLCLAAIGVCPAPAWSQRGQPGGSGRGGGDGVLIAGGVVAGAAAAWFAIRALRDKPPSPDQRAAAVPGRVLATIPLGSMATMDGIARELAARRALTLVDVDSLASTGDGLIVFEAPSGTDVFAAARALARERPVRAAQPEYRYQAAAGGTDDLAYAPRMLGLDRLPSRMTGRGIRVALVDTGVDTACADLRGKVEEVFDATDHGFTPDLHGTLMAGGIVAEPGNEVGADGVAPGARLLAIKACQPSSPGSLAATGRSSAIARGIDFAIVRRARVLNLSISGPRDPLVARLVAEAVRRDVAVVAAAGNGGPGSPPSYPAALPQVVAVTAVDAATGLYSMANRGGYVDLSAPGVDVLSTGPGDSRPATSGTSIATALVSGAFALLLELEPGLAAPRLEALLVRTARDLGPKGRDPSFGAGLVDMPRAVAAVPARATTSAP